jgi:hypothetical protein
MQTLQEQQTQPLTSTHEEIAARAYEFYEKRGAEPGHELDDWLLAEAKLAIAHAPTQKIKRQKDGNVLHMR